MIKPMYFLRELFPSSIIKVNMVWYPGKFIKRYFNSTKCQICFHIETSQPTCSADQLTGFYIRKTFAFNKLRTLIIKDRGSLKIFKKILQTSRKLVHLIQEIANIFWTLWHILLLKPFKNFKNIFNLFNITNVNNI